MDSTNVWYEVVTVLAHYSPMAVWQTSEAPIESYWAISHSDDVRSDRVAGSLAPDDPLFYRDIASVTILRDFRGGGGEVFACDWVALTERLRNIRGVIIRELHAVQVSPAEPPYDGIEVTVRDGPVNSV